MIIMQIPIADKKKISLGYGKGCAVYIMLGTSAKNEKYLVVIMVVRPKIFGLVFYMPQTKFAVEIHVIFGMQGFGLNICSYKSPPNGIIS